MDEQADKKSPFYRPLFPIRAAAQKLGAGPSTGFLGPMQVLILGPFKGSFYGEEGMGSKAQSLGQDKGP